MIGTIRVILTTTTLWSKRAMNVHIDHIEGFVKLISNLYNNKHVMDNTELLSCARRSVSVKNYLEPY